MPITRTRTKYHLLSVLGALMVAVGVLAMAPSAQAQQTDPLTVDKECSPNPVQIGQPLTCTIVVEPASPATLAEVVVRDTFPAGLTVTGATQQTIVNGVLVDTASCTVTGNTVECPIRDVQGGGGGFVTTLWVTIDAIAEQCGTFTNTAEAVEAIGQTYTDTEQITVEGCEVPVAPGQQGGAPAPITQEGEQESEAGEIDQGFEVS